MNGAPAPLPPTRADLLDPSARPYFLWWTDATVEEFRRAIAEGSDDERAYWMGALLREANTRDVWVYVTPDEVRALWPSLARHLGRSREMWAWLLGMPEHPWPPREATGA
ncbi:MAG: hypothetical protein R3A52_24530 [Polyangiales bacterium]